MSPKTITIIVIIIFVGIAAYKIYSQNKKEK